MLDGRGGTGGGVIKASSPAGSVRITGGEFFGDNDDYILHVSGANEVQVSAARFTGGKRQLEMISNGAVTLSEGVEMGLSFRGDRMISLSNGTDLLSNRKNNGVLTVNGGTYTLTGTSGRDSDGDLIGIGEVMFHCGGGEIVINGGRFQLVNSDTAGVLSQRMFNLSDNDITSALTITGGTFITSDATAAIIYHGAQMASKRLEGNYGKKGLGSIRISGDPTFDATAGGRIIDLRTCKEYPVSVTVEGGSFVGSGDCLIWCSNPCPESELKITGGSFTLSDTATAMGGAVLRTGANEYSSPENPINTHYACEAKITLSGGVFINERRNSNQVLDVSVGNPDVSVDGALLLAAHDLPYFITAVDQADSVPLSVATEGNYGGARYYMMMLCSATDAAVAPVLHTGTTVRISEGSEGMRFTSTVPAAAVAALQAAGAVQYGTLLAPLEYVAAAGGFTLEKLQALADAKGVARNTVVIEIPAVNSVTENEDGSITFNAVLVRVKEANKARAIVAVPYAKVGGTCYYGSFHSALDAATMRDTAADALRDTSTERKNGYGNASLYESGTYSPYSADVQTALQKYYDTVAAPRKTIIPAEFAIFCPNNIRQVRDAAFALAKHLGISVINAGSAEREILIGDLNRAETAAAKARIEGEGYYIGMIGQKLVIVGTNDIFTAMAVEKFTALCTAREVEVRETVVSNLTVYVAGTDISFVFDTGKDAEIEFPSNNNYNYAGLFKGSEYATETNPTGVDYPVRAIEQIRDLLVGTGAAVQILPDNRSAGGLVIHVGLTERARDLLDTFENNVNAYGYRIEGGEIIITAYNDYTLRRAVSLFMEDMKVLASQDASGKSVYLIPADFTRTVVRYATTAWITSEPLPELTLSGALDVSERSYQYYYAGDDVSVAAYESYCEKLLAAGYELYQGTEAEGSIFRIYYNAVSRMTVYTVYSAYAHAAEGTVGLEQTPLTEMFKPAIRATVAKVDGTYVKLLEKELLAPQLNYRKITETMITSMQLYRTNIGNCYIITLEDGTFVLQDGGDKTTGCDDVPTLWNVLNGLYREVHGHAPTEDEPITLAAYILTHGHGDHYSNFYHFCKQYGKEIVIERVIANFASNDEIYNAPSANPTLRNHLGTAATNDWLRDKNGDVPYYKVHTGQVFYLRNVKFEILYTHEDAYPYSYHVFNDSSTAYRTTVQATDGRGNFVGPTSTAIWFGDLQFLGSRVMRATYGEYLKSDMVQVAHHGGNGVEGEIYMLVNAEVIWWPIDGERAAGLITSTGFANTSLREHTDWKYIIVHGEYNLTVTFGPNGFDFSLGALKNIADTEDRYTDDDEDGVNIVEGRYFITPESIKKINN